MVTQGNQRWIVLGGKRRISLGLVASTVILWLLMGAGDALACGQCIDRGVRGGTWWLWPLLLSFSAMLFVEVPSFWFASRLCGLAIHFHRWKRLLLGVSLGLGLAILSAGSITGFLLAFVLIMAVALFRSTRAERDRSRVWTFTRLGLIAFVPLLAVVASYPGSSTTESLLDLSLDVHSGSFGKSGGWPDLELARRPDAVETIERRYLSYKASGAKEFELPILVVLHYKLGGQAATRHAWCQSERLNQPDVVAIQVSAKELESACSPMVETPPNSSIQPAGAAGG